jgi:hypothetical protein
MYIAYFDEAKPEPKIGLDCYIVAGLLTEHKNVNEIEKRVSDLSEKFFKSRALIPYTEFHAVDAQQRKKHFRRLNEDQCLEVLIELTKIIADKTLFRHVFARINIDKLKYQIDAGKHAFMYFIERVNSVIQKDERFMLIGDQDEIDLQRIVDQCQQYRVRSTYYFYGRNIDKMIDTVHFARSHNSRLIQLADCYAYYLRTSARQKKCQFSANYLAGIKDLDLFPASYKIWPQ